MAFPQTKTPLPLTVRKRQRRINSSAVPLLLPVQSPAPQCASNNARPVITGACRSRLLGRRHRPFSRKARRGSSHGRQGSAGRWSRSWRGCRNNGADDEHDGGGGDQRQHIDGILVKAKKWLTTKPSAMGTSTTLTMDREHAHGVHITADRQPQQGRCQGVRKGASSGNGSHTDGQCNVTLDRWSSR